MFQQRARREDWYHGTVIEFNGRMKWAGRWWRVGPLRRGSCSAFRGNQTGVSASFWLKCRRRWIMNPHGNAAAAEQTAAFRKLSSQHKQIIPVSFFIISPGAAHQIPPAGLRHRDPGEWFGLSTILFSRFHINKVFCSRRGWKNHNAAEFSLVLFKTTRILTGSFLCFLWDL